MTQENSRRILVVDDEETFRKIVVRGLLSKGFQVEEAEGVAAAKMKLTNEKFDLVLSDIRMGDGLGTDLLAWTREQKIDCLFVLMSGYSDVENTVAALKLGANGLIPKPFSKADLYGYLQSMFADGSEGEDGIKHFDCLPISIDTFLSDCEIPYHVYLKLNEKYVCIAYKGEIISKERIIKYKGRGLEYLYLRKTDYREFVGFNTSLANSIAKSNKIPNAASRKFIMGIGKTIHESFGQSEFGEAELEVAAEYIKTATDALIIDRDIFDALKELSEQDDYLYAHSLSVSVTAVLIARQLRWHQPKTMFMVSLGGLLHDIGKKNWPEDLIRGEVSMLTKEQKELVDGHSEYGAELLRKVPSIPPEVVLIIEQHHEQYDGKGSPEGLASNSIFPIARLINVADAFNNILIKSRKKGGQKHYAVQELVRNISKFDPIMVEALIKVLKFSPADFGLHFRKTS